MQEGDVRSSLESLILSLLCMKFVDLSDADSASWTFDPELLLRCLTNLRNKVINNMSMWQLTIK